MLTGSNYPPFTQIDWPQQGMVTELVAAAMAESPEPERYRIRWRDDWATHLDAIRDKSYDMGFPWYRPDCATYQQDDARCVDFHFSDPVVELVILMFVRADNEFPFTQDADIEGRTLCRPSGYFTHDLDRPGRGWLTRDVVKLVQPDTPEACFNLLMAGEVDAVTVNEFLGVQQMFKAQLTEAVVPLPRPVSTQSLHVIISKTHWRATSLLYRFNAGLARLKQSEAYAEIVSRHLAYYWEQLKG
ncbi:transporter substrate-binding domain-containing protein [Roseobacter sp. YSTF-M11]|uniref:Transporter substrate-binding domain-containing protein n=1 Tax=Roseobacter insulae TaxID=2859783 RepID=A0A9X1K464_9RHOB|nr:transporter substrate-binding domain-containing protein [Roseobacter insulae]MBW4710278.1 transporter substrate-binding domain-containing protein [Roseobacter insulae]